MLAELFAGGETYREDESRGSPGALRGERPLRTSDRRPLTSHNSVVHARPCNSGNGPNSQYPTRSPCSIAVALVASESPAYRNNRGPVIATLPLRKLVQARLIEARQGKGERENAPAQDLDLASA
jgi:hypothetical protein